MFHVRQLNPHDPSAVEPRRSRQRDYDRHLKWAFDESAESSSTNSAVFGTDGSCKQEQLSGLRSTTAAVVGPRSATLRLSDSQYSTAGHGEIVALVAALDEVCRTVSEGETVTIFSDYQNGISFIEQTLHELPDLRAERRSSKPGIETYRWLRSKVEALQAKKIDLRIEHVHSHTDESSLAANLNRQADEAAALAHLDPYTTRLPPLTAWMPDYVPWTQTRGFNDASWKQQLEDRLIQLQFTQLPTREKEVFAHPEHNPRVHRVPDFYYVKDPAGTVAKMQYLTRLRLFPTAERRKTRRLTSDTTCNFCGFASQDDLHLFGSCPAFDDKRKEGIKGALRLVAKSRPARREPSVDNRSRGEREADEGLPDPAAIFSSAPPQDTNATAGSILDDAPVAQLNEIDMSETEPSTAESQAVDDDVSGFKLYLEAMFDPVNGCRWWQGHTLHPAGYNVSADQLGLAHMCATLVTSWIAAEFFRTRAEKRYGKGENNDELLLRDDEPEEDDTIEPPRKKQRTEQQTETGGEQLGPAAASASAQRGVQSRISTVSVDDGLPPRVGTIVANADDGLPPRVGTIAAGADDGLPPQVGSVCAIDDDGFPPTVGTIPTDADNGLPPIVGTT